MSLPVRSVPPTDGAAAGAPWTGKKRRKTLGSLSSDDAPEVTPMDIGPQVQEEQGAGQESDDFVFSAEDDLGYEEVQSYCEELLRRTFLEDPDFHHQRHRCGSSMQEKLYQRLCELRWKDYKILVGDGVINPGDTALNKLEDCPWDNPFEPGPSLFGWTYDPEHFDIEQLDDYQRILPTRVDSFEYYNWDEYRLTFSNYETDQEYVKYCDKISKKMKWVEECMCRDYIKFVRKLNYRAQKQTMKIATMKDFSHLPYSLAKRGYAEYTWDLCYNIGTKEYINVFFELWKRVYKQEMTFEDALKLGFPRTSAFETSIESMIDDQLKGNNNLMHDEFERCMPIPSHVVEDDEALQHITDAVYKIKSGERRKTYLDFVKKKIEVAQRLQLFPASRVGAECPKGSESSV